METEMAETLTSKLVILAMVQMQTLDRYIFVAVMPIMLRTAMLAM